MPSSLLGRATAAAAVAGLVLSLTACAAANEPTGERVEGGLSGTITGAGASSQDAAQQAWRVGFISEHPGVTVNYSPIGSGGGTQRFINGATDFGATDAALTDREVRAANKRCGQVIELPIYISPIAVAFNLKTPAGKPIDNLNLEPETIAKIFRGKITSWDAPAIAKTNPDVNLPSTRITPVHRSDESGTTENFTDYLSVATSGAWPYQVSGNWPVPSGEAAKGTAGVKRAISLGKGTVGYLDASQVGELGAVSVGVGDEFVSYSPQAAAKVIEVSERVTDQGKYVFAYELARDTTESGAYPIVLVSYGLACSNYDDPQTAKLVRAYFSYVISAEGQRKAAENSGAAPLSDALRQKFQPAIKSISGNA